MGYLVVLLGVVIAGFSQVLLKKGAMRPHISFIRDYLNPPVMIGYVLMVLTVVCSMIAYRFDINYMSVPMLESVSFIFVPVLCRIFFKEKFSKMKLLGFALILLGVAVYYI